MQRSTPMTEQQPTERRIETSMELEAPVFSTVAT